MKTSAADALDAALHRLGRPSWGKTLEHVRRWHGLRRRLPTVEAYPWLSPVFRLCLELNQEGESDGDSELRGAAG
jgi:hypothetical protein